MFSDLSINRIEEEYPFREERSCRFRSVEDILRSARSKENDESLERVIKMQGGTDKGESEGLKYKKYKGLDRLREEHIETQKELVKAKTEKQRKKLLFLERQIEKNKELVNRLINQKLIEPEKKNDKLEYIERNKTKPAIGLQKKAKSVLDGKIARHKKGSMLDPLKYENFYEMLNREKVSKKASLKDEMQLQSLRFNKEEFDKYGQ